jgi:hypothetical protein
MPEGIKQDRRRAGYGDRQADVDAPLVAARAEKPRRDQQTMV